MSGKISDFTPASLIAPLFESIGLATLGFAFIFYSEWNAVPGMPFFVLLLASLVSVVIGVLHSYGLSHNIPLTAQLSYMHSFTEILTLTSAGTAIGFLFYYRFWEPSSNAKSMRFLDQLLASGVFEVIGSFYGLVVLLFILPATTAYLKQSQKQLLVESGN